VCSWSALLAQRRSWDVVVLTTKQTHLTDALLEALPQLGHAATQWIAMQNGMGHLERLAATLPADHLWAGISTEGAWRASATTVRHTGRGTIQLGRATDPRTQSALWHKLLINAVINPLTAIYEVANGTLVDSKERLDEMRRLYEEAVQVALAEGVEVAPAHWEVVLDVCRQTAANRSSMLQDRLAGREMEWQAISGYVAARGEMHGLALPATAEVVNLLKEINRKEIAR
jgi:2-dehydropantoate 2-reductase